MDATKLPASTNLSPFLPLRSLRGATGSRSSAISGTRPSIYIYIYQYIRFPTYKQHVCMPACS